MDPSILLMLFVVVVLFWLMSRSARKQQTRLREERDAAIVLGANVVTQSGFLGTIVDIDGDAITLESPSGMETVWLRSSISGVMEIPVADISEEAAEIQDAAANEHSLDETTDEITPDTEASGFSETNSDSPNVHQSSDQRSAIDLP